MQTLLVRYGEIGSKSHTVKENMRQVLRQRVADRLKCEDMDYDTVSSLNGRIIVTGVDAEKAAPRIAELPGVASVSPAKECGNTLQEIVDKAAEFPVGETFGVETHRSADTDFDSMDVNRKVGARIEEETGADVDLEEPETWIRIEVRNEAAYISTEKFEGPDGFPAGSAGSLAALISGGIDSPVAAYEVMTRGAEIMPIYFYNKPFAAEDHFLRFKQVLKELERFNPSREWNFYVVDMEEINQGLMDKVERGRMLLHREIMFRTAEKIAEKEGLSGIVTGESMGQKSSQTLTNMDATSSTRLPIHRPLLTDSKTDIVEKAREIDTYELSEIDSACRSIAPDNPATSIKPEELEELRKSISIDEKVEKAVKNAEKRSL